MTDLPRVFLDISIADIPKDRRLPLGEFKPLGRLVFELRPDVVPKTAENFRRLCVAPKGQGYKDTEIFRVIGQMMCQGGDWVTPNDGTGNKTIYATDEDPVGEFEDENFTLKHDRRGTISMANRGPNTNGSQFFISLIKTQWLDGRYVVFGGVVEDEHTERIISTIDASGTRSGNPTKKIWITDCGQL